jgi:hypothetical protein
MIKHPAEAYFEAATELHYMTIITNSAINVTPATITTVKRIMTEYSKYDKGLLNIILVYALRVKKHHIPNYNYLKKMVDSWIQTHKIDTAEKAFQFFINRMNYEIRSKDQIKEYQKNKTSN